MAELLMNKTSPKLDRSKLSLDLLIEAGRSMASGRAVLVFVEILFRFALPIGVSV